jgi:ATP-dependent DNA helicase RecQ
MSATLVDSRRILHDQFGFLSFRDGQEPPVGAALGGRDALGVLPTGGGKSLCYQVPALALPGLTLVLSPLISLIEDQTQRALRASIPAAFITSALDARERRTVLHDVLSGGIKLLFVAPERLETPGFLDTLGAVRISLIAVDEAPADGGMTSGLRIVVWVCSAASLRHRSWLSPRPPHRECARTSCPCFR